MTGTPIGRILPPCILAIGLTGCVHFRGPEGLRRTVASNQAIELHRTAGVSLNMLGLLAGAMFTQVPDALWHISQFEFGIYDMAAPGGGPAEARLSLGTMVLSGWEQFLHMRDGPAEMRIFVQQEESRTRAMALFLQEDHELTIVRLKGNLHRILEQEGGLTQILDSVDRMARVMNRLGRMRAFLRQTGRSHIAHEQAIRDVVQDAGWMSAPALPQAGPAAGVQGPDRRQALPDPPGGPRKGDQ